MTARFTLDPPLASAESWAGRNSSPPLFDVEAVNIKTGIRRKIAEKKTLENAGAISNMGVVRRGVDEEWFDVVPNDPTEAIFRANEARQDQAAKDYGEPETPHECYAGRPGSQAETIVCDCLRALKKLPEIDRLGADELMDVIARDYMATAINTETRVRRLAQLLDISGVMP